MSDQNSKQTIEAGTEFEGVLRSECPVVISGQLKGDVYAPTLTLTNEGSVHGKVHVKQLKSFGTLGGDIEAESIELSGCVGDNTVIRSASLEVKLEDSGESQVTFGNCELYVGNPATKTRVRPNGNNNENIQVPAGVN